MSSASHLSIITTFSDWSHAERVEVDDPEASAAWIAIQKAHLEDPQQKRLSSSTKTPRGWYEPHVSRYPPPPPSLHINAPPRAEKVPSYVGPLITSSEKLNIIDHNSWRTSGNDESEEELPPRNDPLTPRNMGNSVPNPYDGINSFSAKALQVDRDSPSDSSFSIGTKGDAEYPPSASTSSDCGSGNSPVKMSRRSGLLLSAVSAPAVDYMNEKGTEYKYKTNDFVEVFIAITDVNERRTSKWIMGTVNRSDILPGWTTNGERVYDIKYRIKYCHPSDPSTEVWGIFSEVEIRRLVPRLSNTPLPKYGTLLFIRSRIFDPIQGKIQSTWFPSVCNEYGVFGLVGDYSNALVPPDSRFRPCTQEALEDMRRDGSKILFPWSNFEAFSQAVRRRNGLCAPQELV